MIPKDTANNMIKSIYSYAEMNSYEDNNTDDRLENAKYAAIEVIENIIIPRLDYIFYNDADLQCETTFWNAVKYDILLVKNIPL